MEVVHGPHGRHICVRERDIYLPVPCAQYPRHMPILRPSSSQVSCMRCQLSLSRLSPLLQWGGSLMLYAELLQTKNPLCAGAVVLRETAFCVAPTEAFLRRVCNHCLRPALAAVPCRLCADVCYCSRECLQLDEVCSCVHACMCACVNVCMRACVHVCMCAHMCLNKPNLHSRKFPSALSFLLPLLLPHRLLEYAVRAHMASRLPCRVRGRARELLYPCRSVIGWSVALVKGWTASTYSIYASLCAHWVVASEC